ncbi:four helix bundle protein [uncultured Chryseobacterium sp.]|uniref:four helix bundle protein n=1 Tax=uncultured Chryseobacterium sp. TaxID=259322 RepID=UPI0025DC0386|nr:four helix bundle protein [uncultured Chryseobacterium sp.]
MRQNDLLIRTFEFGVSCLSFLRKLPNDPESKLIRFQLGKSATSIGANYEESQAGSSKADFRNKVKIALREARETHFWLRILEKLDGYDSDEFKNLLKESAELKNILAAIVNNSQ